MGLLGRDGRVGAGGRVGRCVGGCSPGLAGGVGRISACLSLRLLLCLSGLAVRGVPVAALVPGQVLLAACWVRCWCSPAFLARVVWPSDCASGQAVGGCWPSCSWCRLLCGLPVAGVRQSGRRLPGLACCLGFHRCNPPRVNKRLYTRPVCWCVVRVGRCRCDGAPGIGVVLRCDGELGAGGQARARGGVVVG